MFPCCAALESFGFVVRTHLSKQLYVSFWFSLGEGLCAYVFSLTPHPRQSLHVTPQKLSNRISFSKLVVGPRLKSWRKGDPDAAISRVASVREGEHGKLHELITVRLRHFGVPTSNFVIDPRNRLLRQWDVLVIGLVLLTAITVPYEVRSRAAILRSTPDGLGSVIDIWFSLCLFASFDVYSCFMNPIF